MAIRYSDNAQSVFTALRRLAVSDRHHLTLINNAEYAEHVDQHEGISVFDLQHARQSVDNRLEQMKRARVEPTPDNIENGLEAAGWDEMNYLRSYTNEMAPAVNVQGVRREDRRKHPTGFADRTFELRNSYRFRVNGGREKGEDDAA